MSKKQVTRMTLFKIPEKADQEKLLAKYREMPAKATKDGKPYIISLTAGQTFDDHRNQGYTVGVVTVFASKADFEYYDTECPAHADLKSVAKQVNQGTLMVFLENIFD